MALHTTKDIQAHMRQVLGIESSSSGTQEEENSEVSDLSGRGSPNSEINTSDADVEDNMDTENNADEEGAIPHPIYSRGRNVYEDHLYKVHVVAVAFRKRTRYSLSDHLFEVKIIPKDSTLEPLILDLEEALEKALIIILDHLKCAYDSRFN